MLDSLFKGKRINKIAVFIAAGTLSILSIITVILVFAVENPKPLTEESTLPPDNTGVKHGLKIEDLYLDDEWHRFFQRQVYPVRDPSVGWSKQEVEKYFIPADKILHEYFQKRNDNYIKEIFRNVE
ncbi:MAG: hypothetical protein JXB88_11580 [Spirochaetales bacterium]|nr:hypothetical protein [Spirochaetales bacterium]